MGGKKEAFVFKGWVELMEAVVKLAERDARHGGHWGGDARAFLASPWCEEMVEACRTWRADRDARNKPV